jgi:hypothetical protein
MIQKPSSPPRGNWYLLTAVLIGLGLGLVYTWVISPVKYIDAAPSSLRADFKDQYRLLIASSYIATGDLGRAQARLALLKDADPVQALRGQAQRLQLAGDPNHASAVLILLADAIQPAGASLSPPPYPQPATTALAPTGASTGAGGPALSSPTRRPSPTPTSTPGAPFAVTTQEKVCDASLRSGLLQVEVRNAAGQGVPGVGVIATWDGGQQEFFTGFQPQHGNGYADFTMTPGTVYSLQLASNSATVTGLSAPDCPGQTGATYPGGLHLVFQQP